MTDQDIVILVYARRLDFVNEDSLKLYSIWKF